MAASRRRNAEPGGCAQLALYAGLLILNVAIYASIYSGTEPSGTSSGIVGGAIAALAVDAIIPFLFKGKTRLLLARWILAVLVFALSFGLLFAVLVALNLNGNNLAVLRIGTGAQMLCPVIGAVFGLNYRFPEGKNILGTEVGANRPLERSARGSTVTQQASEHLDDDDDEGGAGRYPTTHLIATKTESSAGGTIPYPDPTVGSDVYLARLARQVEEQAQQHRGDGLRPMKLRYGSTRTLLHDEIRPGHPSNFYLLGLEAAGSYCRMVGAIRVKSMGRVAAITVEMGEAPAPQNLAPWLLSSMFPSKEPGDQDEVSSASPGAFVGLGVCMVLGVAIGAVGGPLGMILGGVPFTSA